MRSFLRHRRALPGTLLALALATFIAACESITGGDDAAEPPALITALPRPLSATEVGVVGASTRFGLGLLREVVRADPGSTHVVSPFSASMALGMALNAASGATFNEMREVLGFGAPGDTPLDLAAINASYRDLLAILVDLDPDVGFAVANSVWHDDGWTLAPTFSAAVGSHFGAERTALDFRDPAAPDRIDAWVAEATDGRIPTIAPRPIPAEAVAYLINALHFTGDWRTAFDPDMTGDHLWQFDDGRTATVRMMTREDTVHMAEWRGHRSLDLPYGGAAWSMTVMLPREEATLVELLEELDDAGWAVLTSQWSPIRARVSIPRFTLAWDGQLKDPLSALGMPSAFLPGQADLTGLFVEPGEFFISEVKQKTWLRVDELGTEAAAATSVGVGVTSAPPSFVADRPFLLAIRERLTGAVLFAGAIVEAPTFD